MTSRPGQGGEDPGRLAARPGRVRGQPEQVPAQRGLRSLEFGKKRDGLLYVPDTRPIRPMPLIVMLHGAGCNAQHGLAPLLSHADTHGLLLLAPEARSSTWDVIRGGYGPDVAFIDQALAFVFERYPVDPTRVVLEGFSDGASYALSLGLGNGDLFTHLMAFSPGFMAPARQVGAPRIFISHGEYDRVLPIDRCSRVIVPQLRRAGYDVEYLEFAGPHTVPEEIVEAALAWLERGE
ncbi:alpha/beta hydrolase [Deinococcus metallilatus]|uniref:Alpha/beta hydrolase n=1 Tax=Deinococcus metallilatus TaxID=1211322 RepID=A0AAJ5F6E8_9DEIO|nr:PHB depolymerase family esterase [Deinococcus metallilatus]MBB5296171.1 phospholipase/carboxylesterase [Deinococcus metallilatus]QBY09779.1 alpha/beta hydrolase [Deinococcus metallilatus]RXJ08977.1 alpha/beta hydrolase [Deinococcus metallilatus]TLK23644.1 alpha/beta hydrolase [Deinococcus metallilatus]GMA14037.1 serine esterase [Deinococcus metallilatus]